jgi:hypothetical protein
MYHWSLWDSCSIYERGPSLVSSLGSSCRYNRFLSCLGCSSQSSIKHYFPSCTLFHFISPYRPATWAGSRAGSPVSVSLKHTEVERLQEDWNSLCLIENIQEELCLTTTLMKRALDQKTRKKNKDVQSLSEYVSRFWTPCTNNLEQ